jgi:hypothetical protein
MNRGTTKDMSLQAPGRQRPLHTRKSAWKLGWPVLSRVRPQDRPRPEPAVG